jgi:hypothetical protein
MTKRVSKSSKATVALPADYAPLLAEIKARVQSARIKAGLAANRELLALYWEIGRLILDRQRKEGWGAKVIDRLSADLQREFPGQQGFSPRNLKYMRTFAGAWPETAMVQRPVAQLDEPRKSEPAIVQAPLARISQWEKGGRQAGLRVRSLLPPEAITAAISGIGPVSPAGEMACFSETPAQIAGHGSGHERRQESGALSSNCLFSRINTDNEPDIYADI